MPLYTLFLLSEYMLEFILYEQEDPSILKYVGTYILPKTKTPHPGNQKKFVVLVRISSTYWYRIFSPGIDLCT